MKQRIIIAGGGTGGHIFPAIAIANALKKVDPDLDILFVGAKGKMEMEKVPQAGYSILGLDIAGLKRGSVLKNLSLPFKLIKSFFQVRSIFKRNIPDAVIGVGGYSSFPVLRYAQSRGIPTFIHESNSFAGKSNILLGHKARLIFVSGDGMERFFPKDRIRITGNPVRKVIADSVISREEALHFFGLNPDKKTVFIVGGSLGARSINEAIVSHLDDFGQLDIQLIWQTGKTTADAYIGIGRFHPNVWVDSFISKMEYAYAAADIIVSRAGAMALAELCVVGKPAILVPFPFAAEDHQTVNALHFKQKNASEMIKDEDVRTQLFSSVTSLLQDEDKKKLYADNIRKMAVYNANEIIAKQVLESLNKNDLKE